MADETPVLPISGQVTITPGYVIKDGEDLTEAKLRLMSQPLARIGEGAVSTRELDEDSIRALYGSALASNAFVNGNFTEEREFEASASLTPGTPATIAQGWTALATGGGASPLMAEETVVQAPDADSLKGLRFTGASGSGTLSLYQELPRSKSALLATRLCASFWVFNNTGAAFRPKLFVSLPRDANDFSIVDEVVTQDLQSVSNQGWAQCWATFDAAAIGSLENGMRVGLRFPSALLNAGGKTLTVCRAKLEKGSTPTSIPWDNGPDIDIITALVNSIGNSIANAASAAAAPVSSGKPFYGTTLPAGWLWANGAAVSRTDYAELYAAIGTTYGAGDGATTFNVPDRRGRVDAGMETMGGTIAPERLTTAGSGVNGSQLGATGGSQFLQEHLHTGINNTRWAAADNAAGGGNRWCLISEGSPGYDHANQTSQYGPGVLDTVTTNNSGTGNAQNVPPVLICNHIIRAKIII